MTLGGTQEHTSTGFELVLKEADDKQAIYETWVQLSSQTHGFHRYVIDQGICHRIDKPRPTNCDLSLASRIADAISRAYREQGRLPERITREYW